MRKQIGVHSVVFENPPVIISAASIVGPKEGEGPLAGYFDVVARDVLFGTDSWEQAESEMARRTAALAVQKANLAMEDIRYIFSGDLLNQSSGSTYGMRSFGRPFFGLYGACSAIGEGMALGAMLIDGGFADTVLCNASSHFCSAEKTFRFPLEFGTQRPPTANRTVTGDGAVVLAAGGNGPRITSVTTGVIADMGITDSSNMGAAMAPAAADAIITHLHDRQLNAGYYDAIVTGDLGKVGSALLLTLLQKAGYDIAALHKDCGLLIYDLSAREVFSGGSGCGCAAATFAGYLMYELNTKKIKRLLFVPTGALHSVATVHQGESIPAIAYAVSIEGDENI